MRSPKFVLALALVGSLVAAASADVVFQAIPDNGFFTPFNASNTSVKYGDSGWLGSGIPAQTLVQIDLGLCTYQGTFDGTTDIIFTFNDGDPSGLVFGSGQTLYSTTIHNVALPKPDPQAPNASTPFSLSIPLPNVQTFGGFNNIGWSVAVANYNFDGQFGFQCSSTYGQTVGFYTNNASYYNGSSWSLFSFGGGAYGVADFVATVFTPEPASVLLLGLAALALRRR